MRRLGWTRRTISLAIVSLPLAGCGMAPPSKPLVATIVRCGTIRPISKEQLAQAGDELARLPMDSVIAAVVVPNWLAMRDEARACRGAK
jgi:hypothetical protein